MPQPTVSLVKDPLETWLPPGSTRRSIRAQARRANVLTAWDQLVAEQDFVSALLEAWPPGASMVSVERKPGRLSPGELSLRVTWDRSLHRESSDRVAGEATRRMGAQRACVEALAAVAAPLEERSRGCLDRVLSLSLQTPEWRPEDEPCTREEWAAWPASHPPPGLEAFMAQCRLESRLPEALQGVRARL